jgi:hypothetical protein
VAVKKHASSNSSARKWMTQSGAHPKKQLAPCVDWLASGVIALDTKSSMRNGGGEQEPPQWFKHPFVLCFALGVPILAAILLLRWWLGYEQTTLVSVISGVAAAHLALHLVSGMRRVSWSGG